MRATLPFIALVVVSGLAPDVHAQDTPTDPPNILLRCHGYHESGGKTRRYDCVPNPRDNERMETFVPPVGSPCDEGRVWAGAQPRVFQVRCREGAPSEWSRNGTGPDYFTKPVNAVRVRITSKFDGYSGNFVVWCRAPEQDLIVNELVGDAWDNDGTTGVYRMSQCSEVEVDTEQDVRWEFKEEGARTAFTPVRSWANVSGAGVGLSVEALAALAKAAEIEQQAGYGR